MIQFPVIIFEFVVGNVENYLYFQIGIFNVKITINLVICLFFLNLLSCINLDKVTETSI